MSRYAIIIDNVVNNVIIANFHVAKNIAESKNGIVICVDQYKVQKNDDYIDEKFYRNGVELKATFTDKQLIQNQSEIIDALIIDNLALTQEIEKLKGGVE